MGADSQASNQFGVTHKGDCTYAEIEYTFEYDGDHPWACVDDDRFHDVNVYLDGEIMGFVQYAQAGERGVVVVLDAAKTKATGERQWGIRTGRVEIMEPPHVRIWTDMPSASL